MVKILIAGNKGMVGSSIERALKSNPENQIITVSKSELDLRNQSAVNEFIKQKKPDQIYIAAAKVGGIYANSKFPADFIYDNLMIETNLINGAFNNKVRKVLFLGSSCIYPKLAPQPLKEEYLLQGFLEQTNETYAISKIAGIKLCEAYRDQYGSNFISAMPTNLYGPNDNYDLETSHVLPALLRKFHSAKKNGKKEVILWGSGKPRREFMHVDDVAEACLFLMNSYNERAFVNIGVGYDVSIRELAEQIAKITGFQGAIVLDSAKPDGTPRKLMDVSKLHNLGWKHSIELEDGIRSVYEEMKDSAIFNEPI